MKPKSPHFASIVADYHPLQEHWAGPFASHKWRTDPRYIVFVLARYKHAAKVLRGKQNVVDVGCGDAFGFPILLQEIPAVHGVDMEPMVIEDINARGVLPTDRVSFEIRDMAREGPLAKTYQAAICFDVLPYIPKDQEHGLIANVAASLDDDGIFILGTQNANSIQYSYARSHLGTENFKDYDGLVDLLRPHFKNLIVFGMNDEVIHTGRETMSQYLFAIAISPSGDHRDAAGKADQESRQDHE